jgi:hypothetical protein
MTTSPDPRTGTADWNGLTPETGSMTRRSRSGHVWARRQVRPDGTVRFLGRDFRPPALVQTPPVPGEWLLLFNYGPEHDADSARLGRGPACGEWTAPADPDGFIRRYYWEVVRMISPDPREREEPRP